MVNKVTLIGRLGSDPEVRRLENGVAVAKVNLATHESYKDKTGNWQESTEWHTVILWRWLAEKAEQSFKKGGLVYIEGKLTTRKWQDKDNNDRWTTEVVANTARALKNETSGGGPNSFPSAQDAPTGNATAAVVNPTPSAPAPDGGAAAEEEGGDLPF